MGLRVAIYEPQTEKVIKVHERALIVDDTAKLGISVMDDRVQMVGWDEKANDYTRQGFLVQGYKLTMESLENMITLYKQRQAQG